MAAPPQATTAGVTCPQCGDETTVPSVPSACPVCGERTAPGAAACEACGELLGPLSSAETGDFAASGPTTVTLGAVWRAAWAGGLTNYDVLVVAYLLAGVLWCTVSVMLTLGTGLLLGFLNRSGWFNYDERLYVVGGVLGFAAVTAVGCCFVHGLAGMHLEAARGGTSLQHLFRPPRLGRAMLCGVPLVLSSTALLIAPGFLSYWAALGPVAAAVGMMAAWLVVPAVAFVLFWPTFFLIHERPALRHFQPLIAAATTPRDDWGGRIAVALAAYPLIAFGLVGPLGLLLGAGGLGMFGSIGLLGTLFLGGVVTLFTGPLGGLLLAHAFDRSERAREEQIGPAPLDPEGLF
ncbi:hypothetical protein LzC2_07140 [Planctomycetes bacterium LzC2]|uniref:Zinc ribbon domain-containing protein n=1 Tax=Alienimonas chondri TaxID=2681879 RepID=A0ABX1V981_9PLAN|nr:hypothetical protein [Alienimonas chondri]